MMQALVANQGDGWKSTLEELDRFYEQVSGRPAEDMPHLPPELLFKEAELPEAALEAVGLSAEAAMKLGRRTAEMHLALGADTTDPDFAPEPFTQADLVRFSQELREHASAVFDVLKENLARLPDDLIEMASLVLSSRRRITERLGLLRTLAADGNKIRIHGDFHLGQVLRVQDNYVILDFEGEPARPLRDRRAKQPALKDVAGMLRSFSYAAYAALLNYTARRPGDFDRLEPWATLWARCTSVLFLRTYRQAASGAMFLPANRETFQALLEAYLFDKGLYELHYELNNRPNWVRIPLMGIQSLGPETRVLQ
jgi:maltose alpha-D-glucosyltransferase/alpha-amylase